MPSRTTSWRPRSLILLGVLLLAFLPCGCSDDTTDPVDDPHGDGPDIHTDGGGVGLVIDARDIFRKGYLATTASLTFRDHPRLDTVLDVDPVTDLAILDLDTDDLTEAELTAFAAGVAVQIVVGGPDKSTLATYDSEALVLDNSNAPLVISTGLPYIPPPVSLESDMPYLLQRGGAAGVVARLEDSDSAFDPDADYVIDERSQQFFFTPVAGDDDTYTVASFSIGGVLLPWGFIESGGVRAVLLDSDHTLPAVELVLRQDEDGWVEMKSGDSDEFLVFGDTDMQGGRALMLSFGEPERFRLICDDIDWSVTDQGTIFNQPIMTPAILDFAYTGTLRNCSGATLQETIGRVEQRTRTTTAGTTETMQLFSSQTQSLGIQIGFSVTAKVGISVEGVGEAGEEATISEQINVSDTFTTSNTRTSEQTWTRTTSTTVEVSRVRTLTLPPYTAVEAYDAVKTVENVRVPFTQVLRITGTKKDGGRALSGQEIRSQMLFNFVGGVIRSVGDEHVDVGLRGYAVIDQLFKATTNVTEIVGACD